MIVGLNSNIPYVVKALPEKQITGKWLKDELLACLKVLQENGFHVRGIVSDVHSSIVNSYKELRSVCGAGVHLVKNIRNNRPYSLPPKVT